MPRVFEGRSVSSGGRFAVVASKFNREVTDRLVDGALSALREGGVTEGDVDLVWVPGAFEIPLTAQRLAESGEYVAVICVGAVIRGETDHYAYICEAATLGILDAGMSTGVPVLFGVLTCPTEELALERAGGKEGNKGRDAALAALEMVQLLRKLDETLPRCPLS
ncbi:MAG: 6,7-dimethyl-8-ribityllumazine synthase [Gemmatales bacterium]|nr:6,7-dimethyl-8-ribityllumazine synthase [Gemmatales bacterium]MDW8387320.1 6,7-dimethyl-8-ribityllumazine synthase [Gemmatales bacterium]